MSEKTDRPSFFVKSPLSDSVKSVSSSFILERVIRPVEEGLLDKLRKLNSFRSSSDVEHGLSILNELINKVSGIIKPEAKKVETPDEPQHSGLVLK